MDDRDPTRLTEFPPFEEEPAPSGVSNFLNRFLKPLFSSTPALPSSSSSSQRDQTPEETPIDPGNGDAKVETAKYAVEIEDRSLTNVLQRISNLVALGSGSGTRYADTELARYWMPDDISRECYECGARFSTLRRRHHCRVCGQIFCTRCCSQRVPGHIFGCAGGLRVCNYCCNVVLSYLHEKEMAGDFTPDLKTLQENLQAKFPDNKSNASNLNRDSLMFAREQESRCESRPAEKEPLSDMYRRLIVTLPTQQHRYRMVRYHGVWRGCDLLQWVMDNTDHKTRAQATLVCQNLLQSGFISHNTEVTQFADYGLYSPLALPQLADTPENPNTRLVESVSSYCLDLNLGEHSARLTKATNAFESKPSPASDVESTIVQQSDNQIGSATDSSTLCKAISESGEDHLKLVMRQYLARECLSASWLDVLYPLCQHAADTVNIDMFASDIDIRNYVQVKKVSGGTPKDSCVIQGAVLTKNVAQKGMPLELFNSTVLVLDCSITYQRVEGKVVTLEPFLMQEKPYLIRAAARVCALGAKVILVRGSTATMVQDILRKEGIALAVGVKQRAIERLARCARADIVTSLDARIGQPRLGHCPRFYVHAFPKKTLMVLENTPEDKLGCCILLRGASMEELASVKKVVRFMVLACYHWKLEKAFLRDFGLVLPESDMTFEDHDQDVKKSESDTAKVDISTVKSDIGTAKSDIDILKDESDIDNLKFESIDSINKLNDILNKDSLLKSSNKESPKQATKDIRKSTLTSENKVEIPKIDDPLTSSKYVRKIDSDKNLSCGVTISDFSDPLRARQLSTDEEVFLPKINTVLKTDSRTDRWSSDDVVLSMQPNIIIPPPYLETEAGRKCKFRKYFPDPLFPKKKLNSHLTPKTRRKISQQSVKTEVVKELHPFLRNPLQPNMDPIELQAALANFRAIGPYIEKDEHEPDCPLFKSPTMIVNPPKEYKTATSEIKADAHDPTDPLDPENHQKLNLLLFSYCNKSPNVPDFCVNPWVVTMDMYGRRDLTLGAFLEKYCYNCESKCPSQNCHIPINQHVRKFVHGDVCITVTCNTIGHSTTEKPSGNDLGQIRWWWRCTQCGTVSRSRGGPAWWRHMSLAAYLRLVVRSQHYSGAATAQHGACRHPLSAHAHCFTSPLAHTTALLRCEKIQTFDILLPPDEISTDFDTNAMRDALIKQLNELLLKGHETFTSLTDPDAEKDHLNYKQNIEQIHVAMTSEALQDQTTSAGVVKSLWSVYDKIVLCEKMRRDAHEKWYSTVAKSTKLVPEAVVEEKQESDDARSIDSLNEGTSSETNKDEVDRTEEDEEKGDKKTVRQILSQLLSNNQQSNQNGIIITSGLFPVLVLAGDVGSVIAATLASLCTRAFYCNQTVQDESESSKDKTDGADKNKSKSNEHLEVLLKEGLICRVYYAQQFHKLRHMLLAPLHGNVNIRDEFAANNGERGGETPCEDRPSDVKDKCDNKNLCDIEEGFIRSLAHCVPWEARGGKSGSTFCKTKDDRYVLKEMTKPESQQFLDFAPHYFNYVISCRQNNQPSLLARIVGVYGVGGVGNSILVMENVFYRLNSSCARFDLKGSSRHRLTAQNATVLMDQNLLNLRWLMPFYVQSHVGSVLWQCISRDTNFLASQCVMDYSLLLAVDGNTLLVGIIDYIRTFTWDKKLEHLVKKNLGSGSPTVVSPEQYRARFINACTKYVLHCPQHWDHLIETYKFPERKEDKSSS